MKSTKKLTIIFILFMMLSACSSHPKRDESVGDVSTMTIDSVYLLTTDLSILTASNISTDEFLNFYRECETSKSTLITQKEEIAEILDILQHAQMLEEFHYVDFNYKPVVLSQDRIYLIDDSPIDTRALLILSVNNTYQPIWISSTIFCYAHRYYETSEQLRRFVQRYE